MLGGLRVESVLADSAEETHAITRFRTQKTAALLAYLAYFKDRPHLREKLIDLLWPEKTKEEGRNSLSVALSSLRAQLEPTSAAAGAVIIADRLEVQLNPAAIITDVEQFDRALRQARHTSSSTERETLWREALSWFAGELLPGFYEDWISSEQERLASAFETARESLASVGVSPDESTSLRSPLPLLDHSEANDHLPPTLTRFFGREAELAQLSTLLTTRETTLLTLTGIGGTGKTRLALEVARRLQDHFSGAVWFVPLADIADGSRMYDVLRVVLGLPTAQREDVKELVLSHLSGRAALLIVDNMEQLVEAGGAEVVESLVQRVPRLTVLVTSRRLLGLLGEREFALSPLPVPDEEMATADAIATVESVRLFVDRAQAVRADFRVTDNNAIAVRELCRRLEGIPLAIELAASRVQVLTPAQLLAQLSHRLDFLVRRGRGGVERHRTLRTAIDWSFRLLSSDVQRFFASLSVFHSGWYWEDAEAVSGEPMALDYLALLRECSLVRVTEEEDGLSLRFSFLETIREFAAEQLTPHDQAVFASRHADRYQQLAEDAEPHLRRGGQVEWIAHLEAERENLRVALSWLLEQYPVRAMRMAAALSRYWEIRGYLTEGKDWLNRSLCSVPEPPLDDREGWNIRARAISGLGNLWYHQARLEEAEALYRRALEIRQRMGDEPRIATALSNLGIVRQLRGDYEAARKYHEESLTIKRKYGDTWEIATTLINLGAVESEVDNIAAATARYHEALPLCRAIDSKHLISVILNNLANLVGEEGDQEQCRQYYEESLALKREIGDRKGIAICLSNLADVAAIQMDFASSHSYLSDALAVYQELGNFSGIAIALEGFAAIAAMQGAILIAARFWGAADCLRQTYQIPLAPAQRTAQEKRITEARSQNNSAAFDRSWQEGASATLEHILAEALTPIT